MSYLVMQKLTQRGNATGVSIPRTFLHRLGWLSGRAVVVELSDDQTHVVVRLPQQSDFGPTLPPKVVRDDVAAAHK